MNRVHDKRVEVTATDLRIHAARALRDAEYGTKVTITRDGKPVAYLVPITCGLCGTVIRATASGAGWVDGEGWDHCDKTDTSHEPAATS